MGVGGTLRRARATINFGVTPYVFHDTTTSNTGDLDEANIASGVLARKGASSTARDLNIDQMKAAWDPGNTSGTLFSSRSTISPP